MSKSKKIGTIFFKTVSAQALWEHVITGQLSDGMWENTVPHDHWQFWCYCLQSAVGEENKIVLDKDERVPYRQKVGYNIVGLFEYVKERMIAEGRMARAKGSIGDRNWGLEDLENYTSFEEFMKQPDKVRGHVSKTDAKAYYETTYTDKDLRAHVRHIKEAMKSLKNCAKHW